MSIARTIEDIEDNKATIAILKNRAGKCRKSFDGIKPTMVLVEYHVITST